MADTTFSILGLGEMGRALAATALAAGHPLTVWNRTPGKDVELVARGAARAADPREAVTAAPTVVACLYDHASVHAVLDAHVDALRGRALVNLTTTTPREARELASWAGRHGVAYLDGAIMATPSMIGSGGSVIYFSGSREVFDASRTILDTWAASTYDGEDPGAASLWDLAMLSGMYSMFAGFLHGVAMLQSAGVPAAEFARRAAPFLAAMAEDLGESTGRVDARDYGEPLQSLDWTAAVLETIARASREQGVEPWPTAMVQQLVRAQIDAGHGAEDVDRIIETMRG